MATGTGTLALLTNDEIENRDEYVEYENDRRVRILCGKWTNLADGTGMVLGARKFHGRNHSGRVERPAR